MDFLSFATKNVSIPILEILGVKDESFAYATKLTYLLLFLSFLIARYVFSLAITMFDIDENKKATPGKTTRGGTVLSESKRKAQVENPVLIVGPCNAGKTALFYKLFAGDLKETVSSVAENSTRNNKMTVKFDAQLSMTCVDIPGHFNFRYRIEELLDQGAKAVVLVVDSKDKTKMAEAAEILYDALNNLTVLEHKPPILIACNKTDLQFSKTKIQIKQELEKEIEEIRKVRRAT